MALAGSRLSGYDKQNATSSPGKTLCAETILTQFAAAFPPAAHE